MVDGAAPFCALRWNNDAVHRQQLTVSTRRLPPFRVPLVQVPQLDAENGRLKSIEPPVITLYKVVVLLILSVVSKHANALGYEIIVRGHRPGLPACAEIFAGIKAERRGFSH